MKKRNLIALLMAVCMMFSLLPVNAIAVGAEDAASAAPAEETLLSENGNVSSAPKQETPAKDGEGDKAAAPVEGEKTEDGKAAAPVEGEKTGDGKAPAEGEKTPGAEKTAEGEKAEDGKAPAEGEKTPGAEKSAEGEKAEDGKAPAEGEKTPGAEKSAEGEKAEDEAADDEQHAEDGENGIALAMVLPDEDEDKYRTYEFYVGKDMVAEQIVKNNETLLRPASPKRDRCKFTGWNTKEDGTGDTVSFGTVTGITETETVKAYAQFTPVLYVFFADTTGRVVHTVESVPGGKVDTTGVTYPLASTELAITGWFSDKACENRADTVTLENSNVTVYAKVEQGHWINYNSDGGTYIAPRFYDANAVTAAPADPTKPGYTFIGWFDENGDKFSFGDKLAANVTLAAHWEAGMNTSYTLVYWEENADDDGYTFVKTESAAGTTGASVTLTNSQINISNLPSADRRFFTYDSAYTNEKLQGVTIDGDGSTVVNVYFARNRYTLTFQVVEYDWWGNETDKTTVATIEAKYNQKISDEFTKAPFSTTYAGRAWKCTDTSKYSYALQTLDRMPGFNATFNLYDKSTNTQKTIYYYVQTPGTTVSSSSWPTSSANFTLLKEVKTYFRYATYDEEYHEIQGYDRYSARTAGFSSNKKYFSDNKLNLYYLLKSYDLNFYNGDNATAEHTVRLQYTQSLSGQAYTPERPAGVPDTFEFAGWYDNSACTGEAIDFSTKIMPLGGMNVYAKWAAPEFTGTVYVTENGSDGGTKLPIPYGGTISPDDLPEPIPPEGDGWVLAGWTTDPAKRTPFNFSTQIFSDIELYPYFTNANRYSVTYKNGTTEEGTDPKTYAINAYADVMSVAALGFITSPDKVFLGWATTPNGNAEYQPNDKIPITGNVTLYAVYGDIEKTVTLTYNSNDEKDTTREVSGILRNRLVKLEGAIFSRTGYIFDGWNTERDGSGRPFAGGVNARVNEVGSNVLYAQWTPAPKYTVEYYYEQSNGSFAKQDPSREDTGMTGAEVFVTEDDKTPTKDGYVFDATNTGNVLSGEIKADGSLVLKVYFKLSTAKYTIHHYLAGTTTKVAPDETGSKTIGASLSKDDSKGAAFYPEFAGKLTIKEFDDGTSIVKDETKNVIRIFYKTTLTLTAGSDSKPYDGDPLTCGTFTAEGLINGDTQDNFSVAMTAASTITDAGSTPNNIDRNKIKYSGKVDNAGFVPDYYDVVLQPGTLTVTKSSEIDKNITLTPKDVTYKYDGYQHAAGTAEATDGKGGAVKVEYSVDGENWTTNPNEITAKNVSESKTVQVRASGANYTGYVTGEQKLTIAKREVKLTSASDEKVYDGTALTNDEVTVTGDGFATNEGASYNVTGTQTDVGESDNSFTYTLNEGTLEGNYTITTEVGTLTVTKSSDISNNITLKTEDATYKYDGDPHTAGTAKATDSKGGEVKIEYSEDGENWTTNPNEITAKNVSESKTILVRATSENYEGEVTGEQTLTIAKREVKLTSASDEKVYDGTALTNDEVTVTGEGFVTGEGASYNVTGTQTNVGESDNEFTYALNKGTLEGNYTITTEVGKLKVTKSSDISNITLKTEDATYKYDGDPHAAGTAKATDSKGGAVKVEYSVDGENWTTNPNEITAKNVSESKTILVRATSENYEGEVTGEQTLTITKREVKLTSASDEKVYDGTALTNGTVTVTGDDFVTGEGASYTVTGSQTNVGKSDNSFTYTLNEGTLEGNYTITTEIGTLEVKASGEIEKNITLTTADVEHKYDGNTYNAGTATAIDSKGGAVKIEYSVDGATWTTDPTTIKATNVADSVTIQVRASGANYTGYVIGTQKLTITKRTVTLTSETATKPYDGTALTRPTVAVSGDGFVTGEVSGITATGSVTYVTDGPNHDGVVENTIEYTKNDSFVEGNYTITERPGTLTITKRTDVIVITTPTRTRAYNGNLLWDGACDYTGTLAEGDELIITFATDHGQRNVGFMPNQFESYRVENKATGANVTANYTFGKHQIGTLTVTPVAIELTAYTANKTYDGTPLTAGYQITKGSFVDGEGLADVTVTGSQTDVGESANKITDYTLKDNTLAENYTITRVDGELIVWAKTLTITADSASKTYDGTPLTKNTYASTALANGDTIESVTVTGSQTEAGSSDNVASAAVIKNARGKNVTGNYKITYKSGTLEVTASGDIQNNITLKTVDVEHMYDGKTYIAGTATAIDSKGGAVKIEYSVDGATWTTNPGTITAKNVSDSVTVQVRVTSANYEGSVTGTQKLTITKRTVTLTSASDEKVYDGTALTNRTVTVTGDNFVTGEGASYNVTGSQTNVGKSDNSFTYTLNAGTIANNYTITTEIGKLEVKASGDIQNNITLKTVDVEHMYDGKTYTAGTASATDKNSGEITIEYSANNGATWTTNPGTITAKNVSDSKTVQVRVTSKNYEGSVTGEQKLTITKREVKLTSASDEKVYDGTALTRPTVAVSGDGFVTGEGASYNVTGSQTNVGKSDNSFTYTLNAGTIANNYTITTEVGKLEVTPVTAPVTVKVYEASSNVTYDGQPHSIHGYTEMESDNPLYAATTANIKVTETAAWTATGTDAGEYEVGIEPGDFQNTNGNFTNVVFEIVHGKLVIEKAETVKIELKGNTKTTTYTGSEQSVKGITEVSNPAGAAWKLNEGKEAKASGTDAGKHMMGLTAADFTATSPNYKTVTVKYTDGWLEITPITKEVTVTVTGAIKTVTYNGGVQSVTGHTVETNGMPISVTLKTEGKDTASGTNAGTYMMGLTAADFTATSRNYTNIKVIVNDGWLKIDPITTETTVYVYGNTDYRYYNRNIQTVEGFEVGYGTDPTISVKLADGKKAIAAGRTVKTYIMGLTEKHFVATSPNYTNIKLVVEDGWLAILPNPDEIVVTIRGNSDTVTYDGKEHTVTGYTVEVEDEVFAIELRTKGKDTAKGTEPGTYNMGLTAADFRVESKNYSNVKVIVEDGALKIEPVTGPTPTPDPTEPTPTPELEDIEEPDTPTTGYTRAWALVNLICAILTVIFSVVLLIGLVGKKTKTEEAENGEEVEKEIKKKKFWRFFSIVPALAAVIVFLLTEDMRLPMAFVDRWTLLMVIIGLVQVLVMVFAKKTKKDPDEEEEAKA